MNLSLIFNVTRSRYITKFAEAGSVARFFVSSKNTPIKENPIGLIIWNTEGWTAKITSTNNRLWTFNATTGHGFYFDSSGGQNYSLEIKYEESMSLNVSFKVITDLHISPTNLVYFNSWYDTDRKSPNIVWMSLDIANHISNNEYLVPKFIVFQLCQGPCIINNNTISKHEIKGHEYFKLIEQCCELSVASGIASVFSDQPFNYIVVKFFPEKYMKYFQYHQIIHVEPNSRYFFIKWKNSVIDFTIRNFESETCKKLAINFQHNPAIIFSTARADFGRFAIENIEDEDSFCYWFISNTTHDFNIDYRTEGQDSFQIIGYPNEANRSIILNGTGRYKTSSKDLMMIVNRTEEDSFLRCFMSFNLVGWEGKFDLSTPLSYYKMENQPINIMTRDFDTLVMKAHIGSLIIPHKSTIVINNFTRGQITIYNPNGTKVKRLISPDDNPLTETLHNFKGYLIAKRRSEYFSMTFGVLKYRTDSPYVNCNYLVFQNLGSKMFSFSNTNSYDLPLEKGQNICLVNFNPPCNISINNHLPEDTVSIKYYDVIEGKEINKTNSYFFIPTLTLIHVKRRSLIGNLIINTTLTSERLISLSGNAIVFITNETNETLEVIKRYVINNPKIAAFMISILLFWGLIGLFILYKFIAWMIETSRSDSMKLIAKDDIQNCEEDKSLEEEEYDSEKISPQPNPSPNANNNHDFKFDPEFASAFNEKGETQEIINEAEQADKNNIN